MADIEEIIAAKKPQEKTAWILVDPKLESRYEELSEQLDRARAADKREKGWKSEVPRLEEQIADLEEAIAAARQPFVFGSIGRKPYGRLLDEFPPREDNRTDRLTGFNSDEFPPALIAASSVDPQISVKQAQQIWDDWSDGETTTLFQAALAANKEVVDVPFIKNGSAPSTRSSGKSGSTPPTMDSPTPSS